jgi:ribosomal protein S18 acetylase RimI-like enzyme
MFSYPNHHLRPAGFKDRAGVFDLFNTRKYIHRHPDWRGIEDWLSQQPFWVVEQPGHELTAALACPVEPPGVAWVRLFATRFPGRPGDAWAQLFEKVYQALPEPKPLVGALGLESWFIDLLQKNGFEQQNKIVILFWEPHRFPARPQNQEIKLRQMHNADLVQVLKLDHLAFQPLWQLSWESLRSAFQQSAYATVAEYKGEIVGYQVSTTTHATTCLERLAVSPEQQGQGIGANLIYDLIEDFQLSSANHLTVNTQQDNLSSQALYQKMGFAFSGESYPVFVYQG